MSSGDRRRSLWSALIGLSRDRRGASATVFAIALPVLTGMAALAIDAGAWMVEKRQAQGAADQAAYSAAIAGKAGATVAQGTTEARAVTANMGFVHGVNDVTVLVTKNPTGYATGNYWEVVVGQLQSAGLSRIFLANAPTARARAVAGDVASGSACVIGLGTSGTSLQFDNNTSVPNVNCIVYSNSNLTCGNNCAVAASMHAVGTITVGGGQQPTGNRYPGEPQFADPYADVTVTPPACNSTTVYTTVTMPIPPGRYCAGIDLTQGPNAGNNKTLTLSAGTYYIDTIFKAGNQLTINATQGTTIILSNGAGFNNLNQATLNVVAPSTGQYAGIAIMGLGNTPATESFVNGAVFNVQGAVYFPNQTLDVKNVGGFNSTLCTQLVAKVVLAKNNLNMKDNCPGSGIRSVGSIVQLIE